MPSDLSSYLAKNYLVADPKPTKKRKRKQPTETQGLIIADDDDNGWGNSTAQDDDAESGPALVSGTSAEFRKAKKSNWKTVAASSKSQTGTGAGNNEDDDSAAAADAILASTAAENAAAGNADDEMPVIEGGDDEATNANVVKMSDGTHAGLQSAAAVSAQLRRRQQAEEAEFAKLRKHGKEEETVYRDATGRRVDVSMKRAEARKLALEAEEKERQARLAPKGDVQLENARKRREALEDAKLMTFARTADDEEMNNELKEQERWNDPMAQFLSDKTGGGGSGAGAKGKKGKRRPVYAGAAPPNRYGIKPGYRWDGVDRSNGFEGERFRAINRRERNKGLDYAWQMDE